MEALQEYIKKYTIDIPYYLEYSDKNIKNALDNNNINLVKSIIAYNNYLKRIESSIDKIDELLKV